MSDGVESVHAWGFFDDEGRARLPDGIAPSDLSPGAHHETITENIEHFGGRIERLRVTRELGGRLVGTEFETPRRDGGGAARMWHIISRPKSPWTSPTTPARAAMKPTTTEPAEEAGA